MHLSYCKSSSQYLISASLARYSLLVNSYRFCCRARIPPGMPFSLNTWMHLLAWEITWGCSTPYHTSKCKHSYSIITFFWKKGKRKLEIWLAFKKIQKKGQFPYDICIHGLWICSRGGRWKMLWWLTLRIVLWWSHELFGRFLGKNLHGR